MLSPSTVRADRFTKRRLYQEVGIAEYWVVDADAEAIEVWTPAAIFPSSTAGALRWAPAGYPAFELPLEELFRKL